MLTIVELKESVKSSLISIHTRYRRKFDTHYIGIHDTMNSMAYIVYTPVCAQFYVMWVYDCIELQCLSKVPINTAT